MRILLQRVSKASVTVDGEVVSSIGEGLLLLVGVTHSDTEAEADWLAAKVAGLRVFEDDEEKMNLSLLDKEGEALVVSQFTLYGDARKGRRPSWIEAARPEQAEPLVEYFVRKLEGEGVGHVAQGVFGAMMEVGLVNDGPVTLMLEKNAEI